MRAAKKNLSASVVYSTSEASGKHAALVRGDDGNLHIRRFPTAADAAAASGHRELPPPEQIDAVMGRHGGEMRSTKLAREIGVHPRTIRRAFERGELPGAKEHGPKILIVPMHTYRLIIAYGLRGVGRMAKAGLL